MIRSNLIRMVILGILVFIGLPVSLSTYNSYSVPKAAASNKQGVISNPEVLLDVLPVGVVNDVTQKVDAQRQSVTVLTSPQVYAVKDGVQRQGGGYHFVLTPTDKSGDLDVTVVIENVSGFLDVKTSFNGHLQ